MSAPVQIMLGVITFRRPRMLAGLLESLVDQSIFATDVSVELVVVDNDDEESARETCEDFAKRFPCELTYLKETERGIPFARNKVLDHALHKQARYVAFIDDDETAENNWLEAIHRVITESGADAVQGPVIDQLPEGAPQWAVRKANKKSRRKEGEAKEKAATNNVIFTSAIVSEGGIRFDKRFAMSGGSDVDFFIRATRAGYKLIWTHQAIVNNPIPLSRLTLKWQLQRSYRVAATNTLSTLRQKGFGSAIGRYGLKIVARILLGPLLFITGGLVSSKLRLTAVQWMGSGWGHLAGFWGSIGDEYATIHGD